MPVVLHAIVSGVENVTSTDLKHEHCCPQDVARVIGPEFHILVLDYGVVVKELDATHAVV